MNLSEDPPNPKTHGVHECNNFSISFDTIEQLQKFFFS